MRVLLVVFILCNIILGVFSFKCKSCLNVPEPRCEDIECYNPDVCITSLSVVDDDSYTERSCEYGLHCGVSLNTGSIKQSIICCKTDLCNNHTMPESKNGMECYGCTEAGCNRDFEKIECTSNQNFCATGYFKGSFDRFSIMLLDRIHNKSTTQYPDEQNVEGRFPFRGCASLEACGVPISSMDEINCCCGQFCNRSVSPQYNMLLLLVTGLLPSLHVAEI